MYVSRLFKMIFNKFVETTWLGVISGLEFDQGTYLNVTQFITMRIIFLCCLDCRWTILVLTFLQLFGGGAIAIKFY